MNPKTIISIIAIIAIPIIIILLSFPVVDDSGFKGKLVEEQITETECSPVSFYDEYTNGCRPNRLYASHYNIGGFKELDTKQITGRVVQIETGNHIILESGQTFKISNDISELVIDDIVVLHKISFIPTDCELRKLSFNNGTTFISDEEDFDIIFTGKSVSIEKLYQIRNDYHILLNQTDDTGVFLSESRQACVRQPEWRVEK